MLHSPIRYHISTTYSCLIPYWDFSNWKTQVASDTSLHFQPKPELNIRLEITPSIDIMDYQKYHKDLKFQADQGINPQNVSYKKIFLKGFERFGYVLESKNKQQKILLLTPEDLPQYGFTNIDRTLIQSFDFLDKENLNEQQINILIFESSYREMLLQLPPQNSKPLNFKSHKNETMYVASLDNYQGGPTFHIDKKTLQVILADPGAKTENTSTPENK